MIPYCHIAELQSRQYKENNMKEFEKWRDELHTGTGIYTTAAIRKGWKAALDWVLSNLDGKTDILELALRIRKEQDYE